MVAARTLAPVTNAAPEYALPGRHLLAAQVLDRRGLDDGALADAVRAEIAALLPPESTAAVAGLDPIAVVEVPDALRRQPPRDEHGRYPDALAQRVARGRPDRRELHQRRHGVRRGRSGFPGAAAPPAGGPVTRAKGELSSLPAKVSFAMDGEIPRAVAGASRIPDRIARFLPKNHAMGRDGFEPSKT